MRKRTTFTFRLTKERSDNKHKWWILEGKHVARSNSADRTPLASKPQNLNTEPTKAVASEGVDPNERIGLTIRKIKGAVKAQGPKV